ncbi:BEL1-like homeodomain protein 8 [Actinidia chinensis var. chinensis]|uniref:BEL1-like homeodomain protein 8 n=1 Tax=Actinidia chinensis var. chinensis TaxID=1590841 RepID=A0A2R6QSD4_ACTCC|nr:BEL1-like homeodomain protein 8 [Actinidia chinensis var. chinensis]
MESNNFRPESHVAQRSRRDKLRVQQNSAAQAQHLEDYPNNYEQLSFHQEINPTDLRYGNISYNPYNPAMFSSEMLNVAENSQVLVAQKGGDRPVVDGSSDSFGNSSLPMSSMFNSVAKMSGDPQNCGGTWKSIGSQQSCDWIVNYSSGLTGGESNPTPMFVGEGLASDVKVNANLSSHSLYLKPSFNWYQDVQSLLTNPSSEVSNLNNRKHYEEMHFNSHPLYPNPLLLPNYGDQSNTWMSGELGYLTNKSNRDLRAVASDANTQGLSLSLSSVHPSKPQTSQCREDLHSGIGVLNDLHGSKGLKNDFLCSNLKPTIGGSRVLGSSTSQEMVGSSAFAHRNTVPLGPFTGYATILKGSKFLKPAQVMLHEICSAMDPQPIRTCEVYDKGGSDEISGSADAVNVAESLVGAKGGDSGVSSSTCYDSNEMSGEACDRSSSGERPEYQQKKAKLLFMHEEVCKRYKHYHHQIQMVVSSFESVAGLSSATPYVSLALKTISRHFRCLKNAISDQIKHIRKAFGEDLLNPTTCATSSRGDTRSSGVIKFVDHSFMKPKSGGGNMGFFEPQQPVWRPQRGLPERSVAILRSWLFDHFLHPYPTDTDKHMLATRTGLSRNQVSNWFINARVRLWKPMVEEIHMLETKGLAEPNSNMGKTNGQPTSPSEGPSFPSDDHPTAEQWNREKRSKVECQISSATDSSSLLGFVPYHRSGLKIGGLGPVSLTLGLRQSAESVQQQQEHQIRQHFGGQMIHDFVG